MLQVPSRKRRTRAERQWRTRLQEAQADYRQALEHQERLMQELDQALMEDVDGSFGAAKAHRAAALAFNELVKCQSTLVNVILDKDMTRTR